MLPFAMRSAPVLAPFVGIAASSTASSRAPRPFMRNFARTRVTPCFPRPLFSYSYELLFSQPLCNHIHTNWRGVWGYSHSSFCAKGSAETASLVLSYSYRLFCTPKKANSPVINRIQTLFGKHRGWGYLADLNQPPRPRSGACQPSATWTPIAHPTIIAVTSRFQVHG